VSAVWAVLPAGGRGSRVGAGSPKQFLELDGRSLLERSVAVLREAVALAGVVVALPPGTEDAALRSGALDHESVRFCCGGASRAESVSAALACLEAPAQDWVLVHDAARPCVPRGDIQALVESAAAVGTGAILAAPVVDTLKRAGSDGTVLETVDRRDLWRALTPQIFPVGALQEALTRALADGVGITDEASAMERAGHTVRLVPGSAENIKITYAEDLSLAAFFLRRQAGAAS